MRHIEKTYSHVQTVADKLFMHVELIQIFADACNANSTTWGWGKKYLIFHNSPNQYGYCGKSISSSYNMSLKKLLP